MSERRRLVPFLVALLLLAMQRLLELRISERHVAALLRRGGREHAPQQYRIMTLLHTAWFVSIVAEIAGRRRRFRPRLAAAAALFFMAGQFLRYAAIRTLGERWTARVVTLPGASPVTKGIYRYFRHPNYLGVALEIASFPLLHSAYWTAALFSLANALLLKARIEVEEKALETDNGYARFRGQRRWWPGGLRETEVARG